MKNCPTTAEIPIIICGLETSMSNAFSFVKIRKFLQKQPYQNIQLLAIHNQLRPRIQKGFLIDTLAPIYYNRYRQMRLNEFGEKIRQYLLSMPNDNLYWEIDRDFCMDQLEQILYTYLTDEIRQMEDTSIITKIHFVSETLNGLYDHLYYASRERYDRYIEFMPELYEKLMTILQTLRTQLTFHLATTYTETNERTGEDLSSQVIDVHVHTITPFILVSAKIDRKSVACPVCYEPIKPADKITLKCRHNICNPCFRQYVNSLSGSQPRCVLCRDTICEIYTTNKSIYAEWDRENNSENDI